MPNYWLHVNHPNNKARIHRGDGCSWVQKASKRKLIGEPYGHKLGNRNGFWEGPFQI